MLDEFLVTQIVLLLGRGHTLRETRLEHLIRELVGGRVQMALEWVRCGGGSSSDGGLFDLLNLLVSHEELIGGEPFGSDLGLPLDELDGERGGLASGKNLLDDDHALVTVVAKLSEVLLGALDDTLLLELVRLVSNPRVDDVVGVEDVAVLVDKVLLSESWQLLHPHVACRVRHLEEARLEAGGKAERLLHFAVLALSANRVPELTSLAALCNGDLADAGTEAGVKDVENAIGSVFLDGLGAETLPDEATGEVGQDDRETVAGVEVHGRARVLLDGASTLTEGSLHAEHGTHGAGLLEPFIERHASLVEDKEALREESKHALILVALSHTHARHVARKDTASERVHSISHLRGVLAGHLRAKPVDKVLVRVALEVDHIAALGEENSFLARVSHLRQSFPVRVDVVDGLDNLIERAKLVEHELLGLDLLGGNVRHVLVGGRSVAREVLSQVRVEAIEERLESRIFGALWDAGDLSASGLVVLLDEILGDFHASILLFGASVLTLPDVNSIV
mmetsp:Transcript_32251/g.42717  ORF Transcript_32251/g.42717 Transcript_32251/m.42717 type:complete len:510 (+) Transcript_32251:277-1806(+)